MPELVQRSDDFEQPTCRAEIKSRAIMVWLVGHMANVYEDLSPQFFVEIIIKNLNTLNCWSTLRPN